MMSIQTKARKVAEQSDFKYHSFADLPLYEERYLPRWEVFAPAYYRLSTSPQIYKTKTRDLSYAGVSLYLSPHIPLNEKIMLKIYLSPTQSFEASGLVIWKSILGDDYCYAGILFDFLSQEIQDLILVHAFSVT